MSPDVHADQESRSSRYRSRLLPVAASAVVIAGGILGVGARSDAGSLSGHGVLRDSLGNEVASVRFSEDEPNKVLVRADVAFPGLAPGFHGFHVHANDNPNNGEGCLADSQQAPNTWFVSADGHLKETGETHGHHAGDLPSLLVHPDGTAHMRFTAARIDVAKLDGKALILHAGPDNFGNVPLGTSATQYTANSAEAITLTQNTGNAGTRAACGVVQLR